MNICLSCGAVFSDDEIEFTEEHHPYGEGTAAETWAACPVCHDTNICDAKQCEYCGEWVEELEDGLCDCCHGDIYGE